MKEDLVVLLEWLNANGVSDIFNEQVADDTVNTANRPKTLNGFVKALAEQQKEIKHLNPIFCEINKIRGYADQINDIDSITEFIKNSDIYDNFRKSATNTVILNGNKKSKILVINDLPNDDDDINGEVVSGDGGLLLQSMLKSIDISGNDYCLLNSFFWRLPGNRTPIKEELEVCKPFVEKLIHLIDPKLIIFTGNYSISTIFENNKTLISLRGKFADYTNCYMRNSIKITATYGANFLLKNKAKKRDVWHDLLEISNFLDQIE